MATVGEEKQYNIHVGVGTNEASFIAMREVRDETLAMPRLILPPLQVNMRAGQMPPAEDNRQHYLKIPINAFSSKA